MPTWRGAPLGKVPKFAPTYEPKMQLLHFLRRLAAGTPFCHGQKKLQLHARSAHGRSFVWIVSEVCILFDMHVDRGSLKLQALLQMLLERYSRPELTPSVSDDIFVKQITDAARARGAD